MSSASNSPKFHCLASRCIVQCLLVAEPFQTVDHAQPSVAPLAWVCVATMEDGVERQHVKPHNGAVLLCRGAASWSLRHAVTCEVLQLPADDEGDYELHHDARGFAYLEYPDGSVEWVQHLLKLAVFTDEGGGESILDQATKVALPVDEFFNQAQYCAFEVQMEPGRVLRRISAARFKASKFGARMWWSLPSLVGLMGLSFESSSTKWLNKK